VDSHPVDRFDWGSSHGWYIGRMERWGLLPGDEAAWPDQWQRYSEATGIGIADLGFQAEPHRAEFIMDMGI
jgi:hypothetical protein